MIHNAPFDVGFLDRELQRCGRGPLQQHVGAVTDSLLLARELYPGKSNSLDALCKRLAVDNSARTLHGALLDAGQQTDTVDLAAFDLPVPPPTPDELAAHRAVLADIHKASRGRLLWQADLA